MEAELGKGENMIREQTGELSHSFLWQWISSISSAFHSFSGDMEHREIEVDRLPSLHDNILLSVWKSRLQEWS